MTKYFELNDKKPNQDLLDKGSVDLQSQLEYEIDYGSCTLIYVHNKLKRKNIEKNQALYEVFCVSLYHLFFLIFLRLILMHIFLILLNWHMRMIPSSNKSVMIWL